MCRGGKHCGSEESQGGCGCKVLTETSYVETTDEYRRDGADFVEQNGLKLHRFDLCDEEVGTLFFSHCDCAVCHEASCSPSAPRILLLLAMGDNARTKRSASASTLTLGVWALAVSPNRDMPNSLLTRDISDD